MCRRPKRDVVKFDSLPWRRRWCWVMLQIEKWEGTETCLPNRWELGTPFSMEFEVCPGRLTWNIMNIIMEAWKIIFLSKWVICRFHGNLQGCIQGLAIHSSPPSSALMPPRPSASDDASEVPWRVCRLRDTYTQG